MSELKQREDSLIKALLAINIVLILLNIFDILIGQPFWQITRLIDVGKESNLPTWFSGIILAIASFYAYECSMVVGKENGKTMWQLFSLGLLGMSCDEVAMIHENLGFTINKYFFQLDEIAHSAWSILLGPFVLLILAVFLIKMKRYLKGSTKAIRYLLLGTFLYITGAFVLEAATNLPNHNNLEWIWTIENLAEELFEMLGVVSIIKGLQEHNRSLLSV